MLRRYLYDIVLSLNVGILQIRFLGLHEHFFIIFLNKTDIKLSFFLALKCYKVRILSFLKAKLVDIKAGSLLMHPYVYKYVISDRCKY